MNFLSKYDVALLYNFGDEDEITSVDVMASSWCDDRAYSEESMSAEWPAVIILHNIWQHRELSDLAALYLSISRARVYCSVIVYPE